ncbi:MAG TPA: hypothetical protein VFL76_00270 [Edaphocola sp.]|nr:hypothetical protein [Edaphocola sp.]
MTLEQKKKNRFLFLEALYNDSNGDTGAMFDMWEVGYELKFERDEISRIVDYLIGENLIESVALGGMISLTHWGIKEVEQAIENPDKPTEHFLPINVINIGTMTNSTLQQATSRSTINFQLNETKAADLDAILKSLNDIKDGLNVSNELRRELLSEIQTLEIQRKSPKPKGSIIGEALKSVRTILESVVGNAMTPVIVGQITQLLGS